MAKGKIRGIRLLTDETEQKRYVQIDLDTLFKEPEAVEEYLDGLIAGSRRDGLLKAMRPWCRRS